jgi:hypothetical protein
MKREMPQFQSHIDFLLKIPLNFHYFIRFTSHLSASRDYTINI